MKYAVTITWLQKSLKTNLVVVSDIFIARMKIMFLVRPT
jgi:hypothetical protein